ncbi:arylphorin subunit beta-like [Choristoneura fumiferana]|uniref:arylphorin subunit beta-like n=1 Tax=Choristoneura fumiferana TaxID=7141 RepID=UPI003D158F4F
MKTAVLLAALVALAVAGTVPPKHNYKTKPVDAEYVLRQKKLINLLETIEQVRKDAEWYKVGFEYDIEANKENYTNQKAFEEFMLYYKSGFLPKHKTFSMFYDRMREEAIVLAKLFYYAKDFETFYNTAAWARVHINDGLFLYSYYFAVYQRRDTQNFALPAPYEMYPQYFADTDAFLKAYRIKMQQGIVDPVLAAKSGIAKESDYYVIYSNYSSPWFTGSEEQKISYFTEDIGMNSYYYYLNVIYPFWMKGFSFEPIEEMRGGVFYFLYQQLVARYYMERLTNGLGEIPVFSWTKPLKTGYTCHLSTYYPFFQRNDYYAIDKIENEEYLNFLKHYEQTFLNFLDQGHFEAYKQKVDLTDPKAMNFVGNYWFTNANLYEHTGPRNYERYYEIIGRRVLSGTPEPVDKYTVWPAALEQYQTSLRDPVFFQFYKRILNYIVDYKDHLEPYSTELHFEGVKVKDIQVDKLVTYFDLYDFEISNDVFYSEQELKGTPAYLKVRQPRLNHKPFTVTVDIKSEVATDAVVKFFLGPKYDSSGYPLSIEDNWMNFVQLDWFKYKLVPGENKIERSSSDFFYYKDDSIPATELYKLLETGNVPVDMAEHAYAIPNRMMLPRGTKGGFPFQLYVVVYPYTPLPEKWTEFSKYFVDAKPFGYPFDRPAYEIFFKQPNFYYEDVYIYHEGEQYPNYYNYPGYEWPKQV